MELISRPLDWGTDLLAKAEATADAVIINPAKSAGKALECACDEYVQKKSDRIRNDKVMLAQSYVQSLGKALTCLGKISAPAGYELNLPEEVLKSLGLKKVEQQQAESK